MKKITITIISFYQIVFSPDHSIWAKIVFQNGYCRYFPSCSEYAKKTLHHRPLSKAIFLIIKRVARCNPWSKGGFDYA